MSYGYNPLASHVRTASVRASSRKPFTAVPLSTSSPDSPACAVAGPSRLQGRPYTIASVASPTRRTRARSASSNKPQRSEPVEERPVVSSTTFDRRSPAWLPEPTARTSSASSSSAQRFISRTHSTSSRFDLPAYLAPSRHPPRPPLALPRSTLFPSHHHHQLVSRSFVASHPSRLSYRSLSTSAVLPNATAAEQPSHPSPGQKFGLVPEQEAILNRVLEGESCFLTGAAGSGKTVLLREIIERLVEAGKTVAVTATTGLAAQNLDPVRGKTIHSWSGIFGNASDPNELVEQPGFTKAPDGPWTRLARTDVLIVDEISMMSDDFLNLLGDVCKMIRQSDLPFGGLQVVFAGDFFQLPPVVKDGSDQGETKHFAFASRTWKDALPADKCHFLHQAHRQKDPRFAKLLDRIRFGLLSESDHEMLMARTTVVPSVKRTRKTKKNSDTVDLSNVVANPDQVPIFISAVNAEVDHHNQACLNGLRAADRESVVYRSVDNDRVAQKKVAKSRGGSSRKPLTKEFVTEALRSMKQETPLTDAVELIVGARVMIVQNHALPKRMVLESAHGEEHPPAVTESVSLIEGDDTSSPEGDDTLSVDGTVPLYNGMQGIIERFDEWTCPVSLKGKSKAKDEDEDPSHRKLLQHRFNKVPVVRFKSGALIKIPPLVYEHGADSKKIWSKPMTTRTQIPLKVAFAMSIHKSQGSTLEEARINLGSVWECGQLYVALSRCTTFENLQIENYRPSQIIADDEVKAFYRSFTDYGLAKTAAATLVTVDGAETVAASTSAILKTPSAGAPLATLVMDEAISVAPSPSALLEASPTAEVEPESTFPPTVQDPALATPVVTAATIPTSGRGRTSLQSLSLRRLTMPKPSQQQRQQQEEMYEQQQQLYVYSPPYYLDICHHVRSLERSGEDWHGWGVGGQHEDTREYA